MGDVMEVFLRYQATATCRETTPRTTHFVRGSWPMSLMTCMSTISSYNRERTVYETDGPRGVPS